MTYDELIFKIADSPIVAVGQFCFYLTILAFFAFGAAFFWRAGRAILWHVDRVSKMDREHEAWMLEQKEKQETLAMLMNPSLKTVEEFEDDLEKETFNNIYGEKKNGRSLFNFPDFEKEGKEESDDLKKSKGWTNFVRTYWDPTLAEPTVKDDKLVYPSKSEATEAALKGATDMGLTREHIVKSDYDIDNDLQIVIVEWSSEVPSHNYDEPTPE